jgi:hypothetical protein
MYRLRTMFVPLVGRGVIAPSLVPAEELWSVLPGPRRGALYGAVHRLCVAGVLEVDRAGAVGIVPGRLDEVEQVITRKLTPPWAGEPRPALVG